MAVARIDPPASPVIGHRFGRSLCQTSLLLRTRHILTVWQGERPDRWGYNTFVTIRPLKCNDRVINEVFHSKKVKMSRLSCKWENNYFVTSIISIIRLQRHGKLLFKMNYSFHKDQTTRFIIWYKKALDLIASLGLLRTTECSVHYRGSTAPYSIGRIERRYESFKLMMQTFCIFVKILSTQIIFTVQI